MIQTIEQKARAYDEALEKAKECLDGLSLHQPVKDVFEYLFPELAESEDERIRKAIIEFFELQDDNTTYSLVPKKDILAWLEKQGEQKSTDKVEPKFKNGQWIVWQNKCYKVNYNGCGYELIDQNGLSTSLEYVTVDESAHLWSIQDAKDGDVLFAENFDNIGGCVFLFKGLDSWKFDAEGDRAIATGYCCISITESGNTDFGIQGPDCVEIKRVHPATKEQRNTLFAKMREAGYTWNGEKKELKKIEQKPMLSDFFNAEYERGKADALQSVEWSEEDERMYQNMLNPSDLRPQSHWKPSQEQIYDAIDSLQQERSEMDLEKEIDKIWNSRFNLGWDEKSLLSMNHEGFTTFAKYFYELGLKTKENKL